MESTLVPIAEKTIIRRVVFEILSYISHSPLRLSVGKDIKIDQSTIKCSLYNSRTICVHTSGPSRYEKAQEFHSREHCTTWRKRAILCWVVGYIQLTSTTIVNYHFIVVIAVECALLFLHYWALTLIDTLINSCWSFLLENQASIFCVALQKAKMLALRADGEHQGIAVQVNGFKIDALIGMKVDLNRIRCSRSFTDFPPRPLGLTAGMLSHSLVVSLMTSNFDHTAWLNIIDIILAHSSHQSSSAIPATAFASMASDSSALRNPTIAWDTHVDLAEMSARLVSYVSTKAIISTLGLAMKYSTSKACQNMPEELLLMIASHVRETTFLLESEKWVKMSIFLEGKFEVWHSVTQEVLDTELYKSDNPVGYRGSVGLWFPHPEKVSKLQPYQQDVERCYRLSLSKYPAPMLAKCVEVYRPYQFRDRHKSDKSSDK